MFSACFRSYLHALLLALAVIPVWAQAPVDEAKSLESAASASRGASSGSILLRPDARTISLKIPAPRGMILDRNGEVFAQNRMVYRLALQYQQFEKVDQDFVVKWGRVRLDAMSALIPNLMMKTDEELYQHYRHRRWLPLYVSGDLDEEQAALLRPRLPNGAVLTPVYSRYYPHVGLAAHVVGYSGTVGKLPTGPINYNDPLWEDMEGRGGLEKLFNDRLTGEPGMKRLIFDEHGNKLLEEQVKRPVPGGTLVTTLNLKWQLIAEKALADGCERGAFVVIDAVTGEVLVLASRPTFDLNMFIPRISDEAFKALNEDPATPLYGRAFQSAYPPASTYKPIVAATALEQGIVTAESLIDCPVAIQVGNAVFNNWSDKPEGAINVTRALARSCNTWFYQVAIQMGAKPFLETSRRMGFGQRSGLPLIGETPGILPDDEWMKKHEGRKILPGDTANLSIGQGSLLASPLQVAQAMASIANGEIVPKLQLVYQEQDPLGRVTRAAVPERRSQLGLSSYAVSITRIGMSDVVNGSGGTGWNAKLSYAKLCGKTGTAQWGPESKNQRLAWFAGFLPEENPRYAFAVLYEGKPNQRVSGGRLAAPMVKDFFEGIKDDIKDLIAPPKKAMVVINGEGGIPAAVPVDEGDIPPPPSEGFTSRPDGEILRGAPVVPLGNQGMQVIDGTVVGPDIEEVPRRAIPLIEPGVVPAEGNSPQRAIPVFEP